MHGGLLRVWLVSFHALRPRCKEEVSLSEHTSLGIGGRAGVFFTPQSVQELRDELRWLRAERLPFRVLGGGTNVVCRDTGVTNAVISTHALNMAYHDGTKIRTRAGCTLALLVRRCCDLGLSGMEPLVGIPGTVGGAVTMNAGGRYGSIGLLVEEVRTLTDEGEERVYHHTHDRFSYRQGDFSGETITDVTLRLARSEPHRVRQEMCRILRQKFATQPLSARSAGCVFRNPANDSTGRLIDSCGLKGASAGGMSISAIHANFIVNTGAGTYRDFMELVSLARTSVSAKHGIELKLEVTVF